MRISNTAMQRKAYRMRHDTLFLFATLLLSSVVSLREASEASRFLTSLASRQALQAYHDALHVRLIHVASRLQHCADARSSSCCSSSLHCAKAKNRIHRRRNRVAFWLHMLHLDKPAKACQSSLQACCRSSLRRSQ